MTEKQIEVKHKGVVVATINCPVYDSLNEMVAAKGEDTVLKLANTQNVTNLANEERAVHAGRPSNLKLRNDAIARIPADEWPALAGNKDAIQLRIDQEVAKIKAELGIKDEEE
jgi:hypothetical protein